MACTVFFGLGVLTEPVLHKCVGFFLLPPNTLKEDRALRYLRFFRLGRRRKEKEVALEVRKRSPPF